MERTYLIFRANCVKNPEMSGDFEFCNKYYYLGRDGSIFYDSTHPAIAFENVLTTDRKFYPRNQCRNGISGIETILMICEDAGDYEITITYYDKYKDCDFSADKWVTDDLDTAADWGLTDNEIERIKTKLISFYEEYKELSRRRQFNSKYLTEKYLVNV